jgi:hypothetical protein
MTMKAGFASFLISLVLLPHLTAAEDPHRRTFISGLTKRSAPLCVDISLAVGNTQRSLLIRRDCIANEMPKFVRQHAEDSGRMLHNSARGQRAEALLRQFTKEADQQ